MSALFPTPASPRSDDPALAGERLTQQAVERRALLGTTEELRRLGGGDTAHVDLLGIGVRQLDNSK